MVMPEFTSVNAQCPEVGTVLPFLEVRKLRHRKVTQ